MRNALEKGLDSKFVLVVKIFRQFPSFRSWALKRHRWSFWESVKAA